ncbi:M24 family metallopeptidase [Agathobaculum sp.]|uniref:M24 family metallopeptidase n=1 Tax=Agathobaculum sp. TaxID=2048138 RepID=UPI002A817E32|nr:M24 family metallopeptidase [Agathobaculum sp.]MDY3618332.1 M24 family metallopeptidase [Agathobaculum sp.]
MPHSPVPAQELRDRMDRLRAAMSEACPDWSMMILDNKIDLYYLTGTIQEGALIVTPDEAALFVRRSYDCARADSLFPDIRPLGSFRMIAEAFPRIPETVHVAQRTMTLQKLAMLQKYLPFSKTAPADGVLGVLRSRKSAYELDCMRHAGAIHAQALEKITPALLREGISEARLCGEICTWMLDRGAMGISRFNQPAAEDVLGVCSFGENGLLETPNDSPTGTAGTSAAMKSIGSSTRLLRRDEPLLLDIPCGFRGYHTDKSISYFFGKLSRHPQGGLIRAAHEQCVFLEREAACLLTPGAVPSEIYQKLCAMSDPAFREGFMHGVKFFGHSIGLTMDETPVIARGFDQPLEAGQTFAIEPKIALNGIGLIGSENTYEVVSEGPARALSGTCGALFEIDG